MITIFWIGVYGLGLAVPHLLQKLLLAMFGAPQFVQNQEPDGGPAG